MCWARDNEDFYNGYIAYEEWKVMGKNIFRNKLPAVFDEFVSELFEIFANIILRSQTMVRRSLMLLRKFDKWCPVNSCKKLHNGMAKQKRNKSRRFQEFYKPKKKVEPFKRSTYLRNHTFILHIDSFVPLRIFMKTENVTNNPISNVFDCYLSIRAMEQLTPTMIMTIQLISWFLFDQLFYDEHSLYL